MMEPNSATTPDFMARLAKRGVGNSTAIEPRLPSLFEPQLGEAAASEYETIGNDAAIESSTFHAPETQGGNKRVIQHYRTDPGQFIPQDIAHDEAPQPGVPLIVASHSHVEAARPPSYAPGKIQLRFAIPDSRGAGLAYPETEPKNSPGIGTVAANASPQNSISGSHASEPGKFLRPLTINQLIPEPRPTLNAIEAEPHSRDQAPRRTRHFNPGYHAVDTEDSTGAVLFPHFAAPAAARRWRPNREAAAAVLPRASEPVVNIIIGRVEVRAAVNDADRQPALQKRGTAPLGLGDYLKRRTGER